MATRSFALVLLASFLLTVLNLSVITPAAAVGGGGGGGCPTCMYDCAVCLCDPDCCPGTCSCVRWKAWGWSCQCWKRCCECSCYGPQGPDSDEQCCEPIMV
jgi:hypothetical protein